MSDQERVTVITISRNRPFLLGRAIQSVKAQEVDAKVEHIVISDGSHETVEVAESLGVRGVLRERDPLFEQGSTSYHLARLRNYGLSLVDGGWVAFLDDDNVFESNHFQTLLDTARKAGEWVAHSYRKVLYMSGEPFDGSFWPWTNDESRPRLTTQYQREGILTLGDSVVRDSASTSPCFVDMNTLLIHRGVFDAHSFREIYSAHDIATLQTEDVKLIESLRAANIKIVCSELPTVVYYLGGHSNERSLGNRDLDGLRTPKT